MAGVLTIPTTPRTPATMNQHHRPEYAADKRRAVALDEKQDDEDRDRQRDHGAPHLGRINLQPLDCAQDRNRRRYRAVAIQQGGADEADHDHGRPPFVALGAPRADQSEERQNAAYLMEMRMINDQKINDTMPTTASDETCP